jgi:hypothetical protein
LGHCRDGLWGRSCREFGALHCAVPLTGAAASRPRWLAINSQSVSRAPVASFQKPPKRNDEQNRVILRLPIRLGPGGVSFQSAPFGRWKALSPGNPGPACSLSWLVSRGRRADRVWVAEGIHDAQALKRRSYGAKGRPTGQNEGGGDARMR